MNRILFLWTAIFIGLTGEAAFSQDVQSSQVPDLSDPDSISMPPMDPYSLSYVPERPEGALEIKTEVECTENGGKWSIEHKGIESAGQILDHVGCLIDHKKAGRWFLVNCPKCPKAPDWSADISQGYAWYIDGAMEGWSVHLNGPNDFARHLWHYHNNVYDGTNFHWDEMGSLSMVVTYRDGKKTGRYEEYKNCIPSRIGQFEHDKPVGKWDFYNPMGALVMRRYYERNARPEDLPKGTKDLAIWVERFDNGQKQQEGYQVIREVEDNQELYYYVGDDQYYTPGGQPWFKVHYDANGDLDDQHLLALCQNPDHPLNMKNLGFGLYTDNELCIGCNELPADKLVKKVCFYGTGELWKLVPILNNKPHGIVSEYHPTGEQLASYRMKNGIPDGVIEYVNAVGIPFGTASEIRDGTGHFKSWWSNGNPHEEGDYVSYKKDGVWRTWYENGTLRQEYPYKSGSYDGEVREWFSNGVIDSITPYTNGIKEGVKTWYFTDGREAGWNKFHRGNHLIHHKVTHAGVIQRHIEWGELVNGQKDYYHGHQKFYYPDGKLQSEGKVVYEHDETLKNGLWTYYLKNGQSWHQEEYRSDVALSDASNACQAISGNYTVDADNREAGCRVCMVNRKHPLDLIYYREGEWAWYRESGKLEKRGMIHLGHLNGQWAYYYPNGNMMLKGAYEIDRKVGEWYGFYENGNQKFNGIYKDGKEDGLWKTYHEMDQAVSSEGFFEDGKRTGKWVWYFPSGKIREEGVFEHGTETGTWTSYYENGQKQGEGQYIEGQREGIWIWWREDGKEWRRAQFVKGKER